MSVSTITFTARDGGLFAFNGVLSTAFAIKGVNWFGAEGNGAVVDGLWQRPMVEYLDEIAGMGFNAIRRAAVHLYHPVAHERPVVLLRTRARAAGVGGDTHKYE